MAMTSRILKLSAIRMSSTVLLSVFALLVASQVAAQNETLLTDRSTGSKSTLIAETNLAADKVSTVAESWSWNQNATAVTSAPSPAAWSTTAAPVDNGNATKIVNKDTDGKQNENEQKTQTESTTEAPKDSSEKKVDTEEPDDQKVSTTTTAKPEAPTFDVAKCVFECMQTPEAISADIIEERCKSQCEVAQKEMESNTNNFNEQQQNWETEATWCVNNGLKCGDTCVVEGDMAGMCDYEGKCSFNYENLGCLNNLDEINIMDSYGSSEAEHDADSEPDADLMFQYGSSEPEQEYYNYGSSDYDYHYGSADYSSQPELTTGSSSSDESISTTTAATLSPLLSHEDFVDLCLEQCLYTPESMQTDIHIVRLTCAQDCQDQWYAMQTASPASGSEQDQVKWTTPTTSDQQSQSQTSAPVATVGPILTHDEFLEQCIDQCKNTPEAISPDIIRQRCTMECQDQWYAMQWDGHEDGQNQQSGDQNQNQDTSHGGQELSPEDALKEAQEWMGHANTGWIQVASFLGCVNDCINEVSYRLAEGWQSSGINRRIRRDRDIRGVVRLLQKQQSPDDEVRSKCIQKCQQSQSMEAGQQGWQGGGEALNEEEQQQVEELQNGIAQFLQQIQTAKNSDGTTTVDLSQLTQSMSEEDRQQTQQAIQQIQEAVDKNKNEQSKHNNEEHTHKNNVNDAAPNIVVLDGSKDNEIQTQKLIDSLTQLAEETKKRAKVEQAKNAQLTDLEKDEYKTWFKDHKSGPSQSKPDNSAWRDQIKNQPNSEQSSSSSSKSNSDKPKQSTQDDKGNKSNGNDEVKEGSNYNSNTDSRHHISARAQEDEEYDSSDYEHIMGNLPFYCAVLIVTVLLSITLIHFCYYGRGSSISPQIKVTQPLMMAGGDELMSSGGGSSSSDIRGGLAHEGESLAAYQQQLDA